jgi:hypothetical protein
MPSLERHNCPAITMGRGETMYHNSFEDFVDDGGVPCAWKDEFGGGRMFWPLPDSDRTVEEP